MKTKFIFSFLFALIAFVGVSQTIEGNQIKLDDNQIAFAAFQQPQTVAIDFLQLKHEVTIAQKNVPVLLEIAPDGSEASAFRMPPPCPSGAYDQSTVTSADGSAVSYCIYWNGPGSQS